MKKLLLILSLLCSPLIAQDAKVAPLMEKPFCRIFQEKEVQILTVEYPPGGHDPVHRHNAHGFIYVLEGSIVMAVNGRTARNGISFVSTKRWPQQCFRSKPMVRVGTMSRGPSTFWTYRNRQYLARSVP
jgi:cupin domain